MKYNHTTKTTKSPGGVLAQLCLWLNNVTDDSKTTKSIRLDTFTDHYIDFSGGGDIFCLYKGYERQQLILSIAQNRQKWYSNPT